MQPDLSKPEIAWAIEAVETAARLTTRIQKEIVLSAVDKSDRSPVTVADFAVQAYIAHALSRALPSDALVGEESSSVLKALPQGDADALIAQISTLLEGLIPADQPKDILRWIDRGNADPQGRYWTLDPVDGTKGFLRGDHYAIALALIEEGAVKMGVLGCPKLPHPDASSGGSLTVGIYGQGAWARSLDNGRAWSRLQVSGRNQARDSIVLRSVEREHTHVSKTQRLMDGLGVEAPAIAMDSAAKYAVLAGGRGDIFIRIPSEKKPAYKEKVWDLAAGTLIVQEAGGRVTDVDGRALDFYNTRSLDNNRGMLATNGLMHDRVLEALRNL